MENHTKENEIFYGGDSNIPPCDKNVGQYLLDRMAKYQGKIAQIDPINNITQTYGELRINSIRCALKMKANGIKRGDIVMIGGRIHMDLIIPVYGTMLVGATAYPFHPDFTRNEILRMIKVTEPKMIFCDKECTDLMIELTNELNLHTKIVTFETDFKSYLTPHGVIDEENFVAETVDVLNDNVLILCTSGSTGIPKDITRTHNALYMTILTHRVLVGDHELLLFYAPLSWVSAIQTCCLAVWNGRSKITCEYDPTKNLEIILAYNIDWIFLTSIKLNEMIQHPLFKQNLSRIVNCFKTVLFGGSLPSFETVNEYHRIFKNAFIFNCYGCTEMSGGHALFDITSDLHKNLNKKKIISTGVPIPGTYWKLIDPETGKPVGRNQKGELLIKGPTLTKGYYKDPESTAKAIDKDGWLHTGDLVMVDDDNCLFAVGRSTELLKYKGCQISPNELEAVVLTHSSVQNACVMSRPHETDGDLPLAFVVKKTTAADVTDVEIINFVNNQVTDCQKLRGGVIFLDNMPIAPSGKIQKLELKKLIS